MIIRNLSEWADIVAELANQRLPLWRDRLKRPVEYDRTRLGEIARATTKAGLLGEESALQVAQSGILALEMPWQVEWNQRTNVMGHA